MSLIDGKSIVVKHFPKSFNNDEKIELLRHFGAIAVDCNHKKNLNGINNNNVFATFLNHDAAMLAIQQLHQQKV